MSAEELISRIAEVAFVVLAAITVARAFRNHRIVKVHTAAFFVLIAAIMLIGWARDLELIAEDELKATALTQMLLVAIPYPLLRLAGDFTGVSRLVRHSAEAALLLSWIGLIAFHPEELPGWFVIFVVVYFVGTVTYASAQFVQAAATMRSVSRLRMSFAAAGSLAIAAVIFLAGLRTFFESPVFGAISAALVVVAGFAYYLGFAMPGWFRRAVHANHLQRFLAKTVAAAPGVYREGGGLEEIESAVADALGTPDARIVLWNEETEQFFAPSEEEQRVVHNPRSTVGYRVIQTQEPYFTENAAADDPENPEAYEGPWGRLVMLAAPITLDGRRFGLLTAFGGLPPFIHDDDLSLLQIMANQIAVILRDRELLREVTEARAREETMRLMDDFFAAVAHDLKTPLTTILGQGQRLQRQARRQQPLDPEAVESIVQQAVHMRRLVEDLLDDARDRGQYSGERVPSDLLTIAEDVVRQAPAGKHDISVSGDRVVVPVDAERIRQVLTNLVENAVKYSPDGGPISVGVRDRTDCAEITVTDEGIGVPPADIETIFERFSRGSREPDRRFSGLGLGLYTCRRIVEEHGGRIEVESRLGAGSTFTVHLPVANEAANSGEVGYAQTGGGN